MATEELRKSPRFQVEAPVQLWIGADGGSQRSIRALAVNVSRTGMYLRGGLTPPLDAKVHFEAKMPPPIGGSTGCLFRGSCRVARRDDLGACRLGWAAIIDSFEMRPLTE
jgi:hypothetical protein